MIKGDLYLKNSSSCQEVNFYIIKDKYYIKNDDITLLSGYIENINIPTRLGNVPRKIKLENGETFSTNQNDLVDLYLSNKNKNLIHKLESNFLLILFSLIFTVAFIYSFVVWGIPYTSKKIAYALPSELNKTLSDELLKNLDEVFLHKSLLDENKKKMINEEFAKNILPNIESKSMFDYKLHFRNIIIDDKSIANAFALPNGDIVITDGLIRMSKNQEEIISVIYHEIGHIEKRHSLQRIIQGSFLTLVSMFLTGDVTFSSDFIIGVGSLFVNTNYSRTHEIQADKFALDKMLQTGINPKYFSSILNKITGDQKDENTNNSFFKYFSTHPTTHNRDILVDKYVECFKQKLKSCDY